MYIIELLDFYGFFENMLKNAKNTKFTKNLESILFFISPRGLSKFCVNFTILAFFTIFLFMLSFSIYIYIIYIIYNLLSYG